MPNYCYKEPKTDRIITRFFPSDSIPEYIKLDGVKCERCREAEWAGQGGMQASTWPMKSDAMAVHASQREQFMEFAAEYGVPTYFDERGRPEFRSKGHRKAYCELVGATDLDGGTGDPFCG